MHPKFAADDLLDAAARGYLEQHPELDPERVSVEFRGNPATGYQAVGHVVLDRQPGYAHDCCEIGSMLDARDRAIADLGAENARLTAERDNARAELAAALPVLEAVVPWRARFKPASWKAYEAEKLIEAVDRWQSSNPQPLHLYPAGWCETCNAPWDVVSVGTHCPAHNEPLRLAPWTQAHREWVDSRASYATKGKTQ